MLELAPEFPAVWTERFTLAGLLFAITCMSLGVTWDVHWHAVVGRESFWTPPHMILYLGVVMAEVLGFISVCRAIMRERSRRRAVTLRGLLSHWYGSVALGSAIMLVAAGFDVAWHRTIGDRTIWSPPHVLGIAGALLVTLATTVGLFQTSRREIFACRWIWMGGRYLLAAFLVVPYFGLLPGALMVFHPGGAGLNFVVKNPYLVAGLASLMMPGVIICYQQVLGKIGFEITAIASIGLWVVQEFFHSIATPPVAKAYGYFISAKQWNFPGLGFELLVLEFIFIPAFMINRLPVRQPSVAVALLAMLYIVEDALWLGVLRTVRGASVLPALTMVISGAVSSAPAILALSVISSTVGTLCSRWITYEGRTAD